MARYLIDEDIDIRVGALLAQDNEVRHARDVFGMQTHDATNVSWARAMSAILITADNALARSLKGSRRCGCLHLHDLRTRELDRVRELLGVIESEAAIQGERFWMQISAGSFLVGR